MGGWQSYQIPDGWVARGWRFEVEPTTPEQPSLIFRHFGARRFAHNWALAQVKANLDARIADPAVPPLAWTLPTLRKAWNQAKDEVAPWWPSCSKEAYACGIADLVQALQNWSDSKHGHRAGRRVGFPGSRPVVAIMAGSGSPLARCAWNPTAATSPSRSSGSFAARRTPGGSSGCSAMVRRGSCR
jgi:Helix-turn-helix domain